MRAATSSVPSWMGSTFVAFVIAFAASMTIAVLQGVRPFYYDASTYWALADTFVRDGHFSFLNFDSPLRGYVLPLINKGLWELSDAMVWNHSSGAKLFNAGVFALIGTVLGPRLAMIAWPQQRWGFWRRIGLMALVLLFWRGYLNYPLSDFPAIAAVMLAVIAVSRSNSLGWMFVAGVSASVAINMRPAYLLVIPVLAVLVLLAWWGERHEPHPSWKRRALCVGLLIAGFVLIALPQSLSTHKHHGQWSFVPGAVANLSSLQFTEGMHMQRYETYVGTEARPRMIFEDPIAYRLLLGQEGGVIVDARQYVGVVLTHPVTMGGLFARHVINGLDQRYDTPYIEHLDTGGNRWMRMLGFLLVFLALARVAWPEARRRLGPARWRYPVALLVCGMTSIASAVEARFLLPAALLAYIMVLTPGWPNPLASTDTGIRRWRTPLLLVAAYAIFMAIVLHVIAGATDNLIFG